MPKPEVNVDACIGCGACVNVCPNKVLELVDGKCKVVRPEACTGCRQCETVCPVGAIKVSG